MSFIGYYWCHRTFLIFTIERNLEGGRKELLKTQRKEKRGGRQKELESSNNQRSGLLLQNTECRAAKEIFAEPGGCSTHNQVDDDITV